MTRLLQFVLCIFLQIHLWAQQEGRMETDRPDQTESPFLTKKNYLQVEIGLGLAKEQGYSTIAAPTILWKYGLSKKFELRLVSEINVVKNPPPVPDGHDVNTGLVPLQIGGKLSLFEENGLLPKTSFIFHAAIPKVASRKFQAAKWAPEFVFAMQNTLSKTLGLGYNFGMEWDGETDKPFFIYTLSPGANVGDRWYTFIELFGGVQANQVAKNSIDGGLGYYINDNMKLDASAGWGITKPAVDYFVNVGFSFRFH